MSKDAAFGGKKNFEFDLSNSNTLACFKPQLKDQLQKPDVDQEEHVPSKHPPLVDSSRPQSSKPCDTCNVVDILGHLVCNISNQLPVDPVIAEDGRIYDRQGIKRHFEEQKTSPVDKKPIGATLIDGRHISCLLQSMVDSKMQNGLLSSWAKARSDANKTEDLPCGESKRFVDGQHVRSTYRPPHMLQGRIVHFSNDTVERVVWSEQGVSFTETWDNGTKTRIAMLTGDTSSEFVWDPDEQVWLYTTQDQKGRTFVTRNMLLLKACVPSASVLAARHKGMLYIVDNRGFVDFTDSDPADFLSKDQSFVSFRRRFSPEHSRYGQIDIYTKGVRAKTMFYLDPVNRKDHEKTVFYNPRSGVVEKIEWEATAQQLDCRNTVEYYSDGRHDRTLLRCGSVEYYTREGHLVRREVTTGEIQYFNQEGEATRICSVEYKTSHPFYGVKHIFEDCQLKKTEYGHGHRYREFVDVYSSQRHIDPVDWSKRSECSTDKFAKTLETILKSSRLCNIIAKEHSDAFAAFITTEMHRFMDVQLSSCLKFIRICWLNIDTRQSWLYQYNKGNKRPHSSASVDELSAKRVSSAECQSEDDCVFVKVSTRAERDAVGFANAVILE